MEPALELNSAPGSVADSSLVLTPQVCVSLLEVAVSVSALSVMLKVGAWLGIVAAMLVTSYVTEGWTVAAGNGVEVRRVELSNVSNVEDEGQ